MVNAKKPKKFWAKKERTKALIYQEQVAAERTKVISQLEDIERYDQDFLAFAKAAAQSFLDQSEKLLDLTFAGRKQRFHFITLSQFEKLVSNINAAVNVWNITMQSPLARTSNVWSRFRQQQSQLRELSTYSEQKHADDPDKSLTVSDVQ